MPYPEPVSSDHGTTRDASPAPEQPRSAWVAVTYGAHRDVIELPEGSDVSVGRSRSSGIPVHDEGVSRLHATLTWSGGPTVRVVDHGSRNGVFLGGERVERADLGTGDVIVIGPARIQVIVPPKPREPTRAFAVDPAMRPVVAMADKSAQCHLPVLILGETGVGKEVLARHIHDESPRAAGPFVPVNCGSIPEPLAESILFGHEKGAFTGADRTHPGVFERADGGSLFLDEVGELSSTSQARLLRVLEERHVYRVGATSPTAVDVRILAATHRDIDRMVAAGDFRRDLLYRLDVLRVEIPPLRERPDDVIWLAGRFLVEQGEALSFDGSALEALRGQPWRGNVRELGNAIARAVALRRRDVLSAADFAFEPVAAASGGVALSGAVADAEREAIEAALASCDGNQTRAAARLGISRRALIYKMEKHALKPLPPSKRDHSSRGSK